MNNTSGQKVSPRRRLRPFLVHKASTPGSPLIRTFFKERSDWQISVSFALSVSLNSRKTYYRLGGSTYRRRRRRRPPACILCGGHHFTLPYTRKAVLSNKFFRMTHYSYYILYHLRFTLSSTYHSR